MITKVKGEKIETLENFLKALDDLKEIDLICFIDWFLNRKHDRKIAIKELRDKMAKLNFVAGNFYDLFNSRYYYPSLNEIEGNREEYFTVEELAQKFKVCEKTISNWEKSGLRVLRPSPRVLVVSKKDLYDFFEQRS